MADYPWYSYLDDEPFEQGDILFSFPSFSPAPLSPGEVEARVSPQGRIDVHNVIILSQSCDLGWGKVPHIIVCPVFPFDQAYRSANMKFSVSTFEEIKKGRRPAYHLLNPCDIQGLNFPHLIVHFGQVAVTSFGQLQAYQDSSAKRVRLLPPYREHLAQAFARFVMRIGLPQDVTPLQT